MFAWRRYNRRSCSVFQDHLVEVGIHNFSGYVHVDVKFGTVVKQLKIRGTNGLSYTYNVSRARTVESEERIFQLFRVANNYLHDFKVGNLPSYFPQSRNNLIIVRYL